MFSAKYGKMGMMMPNPSMVRKAIRNSKGRYFFFTNTYLFPAKNVMLFPPYVNGRMKSSKPKGRVGQDMVYC